MRGFSLFLAGLLVLAVALAATGCGGGTFTEKSLLASLAPQNAASAAETGLPPEV